MTSYLVDAIKLLKPTAEFSADAKARASNKTALLERLGITEDEFKILLS